LSIKSANWGLKVVLDVQITLPPDETNLDDEEDEKDKKRARMKVKFDENGFPTVPWPDMKLDEMTKEELIDYIRLCKRSLKQGAAMYTALNEKLEKKETERENSTGSIM
jgi:hypothetical protein